MTTSTAPAPGEGGGTCCVGFVQFTFCDHEAEEFVTLGRTPRMDRATLTAFFEGLPPPNDPDSPFLADLWSDGECHDDDRPVSAAAIEALLNTPLDVLLAAGRAENARCTAMLRARRHDLSGGEG